MRIYASIALFLILSCSAAAAQGRKVPPTKRPAPSPVVSPVEVPGDKWFVIKSALEDEAWDRALSLITPAIAGLTVENEKKQLAQLRYFHIYALAGKSFATGQPRAELELALNSYQEKQFMMPARMILSDCRNSVNMICLAKNSSSILRVTATNKSGSAIHSFEYVEISNPFNTQANHGRQAFLSGYLKKFEINRERNKPWVIRLFFNGGDVRVIS
jgi:hypothetical protein